jgi:Na+/H+ antiporter NhaC
MLIISIPATVLAVASYRGSQYVKAMAVIFVGAAIVGGLTFYAFGLGLLHRAILTTTQIPSQSIRGMESSGQTKTIRRTP